MYAKSQSLNTDLNPIPLNPILFNSSALSLSFIEQIECTLLTLNGAPEWQKSK